MITRQVGLCRGRSADQLGHRWPVNGRTVGRGRSKGCNRQGDQSPKEGASPSRDAISRARTAGQTGVYHREEAGPKSMMNENRYIKVAPELATMILDRQEIVKPG